MPPAHPAPQGPTSGVATFMQFNRGMYAPSAVDAHTTQDLPPYPAGGVEFQSGAPGTGYGAYSAVQSDIVAQGMSELLYVISLSIATKNGNDSRCASQNPPFRLTMVTT